jgi:hypothetical protein
LRINGPAAAVRGSQILMPLTTPSVDVRSPKTLNPKF